MSSCVKLSIATNTAIFLAKGFGGLVTGSPMRFAESIHSLADVGNQVLPQIGEGRSGRMPTPLRAVFVDANPALAAVAESLLRAPGLHVTINRQPGPPAQPERLAATPAQPPRPR